MPKLRRKQLDLILSDGPTDGVYGTTNAAGLSNSDKLEDAFDKVAVILDALVPPNAPNITSISNNQTGVTGKLSFGTSNVVPNYDNAPGNINSTYTVSGNTKGIINATTNLTGTLANNVSADTGTPNPAYPANSFSPGNIGTLQLKLDGVIIHTVNLSTFGSGASVNANGSGFTLSAATSAVFPGGTPFPSFKYRTGTYVVNQAEWATTNRGYKTVQITHVYSGVSNTQTYDFVVDGNTATITASGSALDALSMTGSKQLSGVTYHTAGSAQYDITLAGVYPFTYSSSASAISFVATNGTIPAQAIPNMILQTDNVVITNAPVTVTNSGRLLGTGISVATSVLRTVQTTVTGLGSQSAFALLLDNIAASSTNSIEQFNDEVFRMTNGIESNLDDTTGYASGTGVNNYGWDESQSLVGGSALHNNGLLVFNGTLRYPNNTTGTSVTTGNFGAVANGPGGNPNYTSASGIRVYYRYYYRPSQSNFVMNVTASSVTFVNSSTTPSGNNLNIEILAPSQTKNGSNVTVWKDCVTAYTADSAIGAYNASGGANVGSIAGANWGLTIGTKTTANSGNVIILRIRAAAAWTGLIDTINIA